MNRLRFLTAGESHGKCLTAIVEGIPVGLSVSEDDVAYQLRRRQKGHGRGGRMTIEQDEAQIISGVRHGLTIGSPITMLIENREWEKWKDVMSVRPVAQKVELVTHPRPGHADLAGVVKYGLSDIRPILERSSARETAARVAVGAIARRLLEEFGVLIHSHTVSIGERRANVPEAIDWDRVEASAVRCADAQAEEGMVAAIDEAASAGDSLGGVFELVATGVPVGLGSHVHWDRRLDGRIAQAIMSINAVKGVEIGSGFGNASLRGSQVHDAIAVGNGSPYWWQRASNHAGGVEGGISNGESVVVRGMVKPVPTLRRPLSSIDIVSGEPAEAHFERSDVCIVPAAGVIGEAMLAIVLADAFLEKFGGDALQEIRRNYRSYLDSIQGRA